MVIFTVVYKTQNRKWGLIEYIVSTNFERKED